MRQSTSPETTITSGSGYICDLNMIENSEDTLMCGAYVVKSGSYEIKDEETMLDWYISSYCSSDKNIIEQKPINKYRST